MHRPIVLFFIVLSGLLSSCHQKITRLPYSGKTTDQPTDEKADLTASLAAAESSYLYYTLEYPGFYKDEKAGTDTLNAAEKSKGKNSPCNQEGGSVVGNHADPQESRSQYLAAAQNWQQFYVFEDPDSFKDEPQRWFDTWRVADNESKKSKQKTIPCVEQNTKAKMKTMEDWLEPNCKWLLDSK
jgi:hypothetical protein